MAPEIVEHLEAHGHRARVVPIARLRDSIAAIERFHAQDALDAAFYEEFITRYSTELPAELPDARSLVVVATADPPVRLTFGWHGERVPVVVPPTYVRWREKHKRVRALLAELLEPEGYRVAYIVAPKKPLAVCSGLASYGRNNIACIPGWGSFFCLAVFCTDAPCETDDWREPVALERCERCTACATACPAGAIDPERFLLHAERCITWYNEKSSEAAFPAWMESSWQECLVGCMRCQLACPENRGVAERFVESAEFTEEETRVLLEGADEVALPAGLRETLERTDLLELLEVIPRNLAAALGE